MRQRLSAFGREVEIFHGVPMSNGRLQRYFDGLLPPLGGDAGERERGNRLRALDQLNANFTDETNSLPGMRGTLWAALNAATLPQWQYLHGATFTITDREGILADIWIDHPERDPQKGH